MYRKLLQWHSICSMHQVFSRFHDGKQIQVKEKHPNIKCNLSYPFFGISVKKNRYKFGVVFTRVQLLPALLVQKCQDIVCSVIQSIQLVEWNQRVKVNQYKQIS